MKNIIDGKMQDEKGWNMKNMEGGIEWNSEKGRKKAFNSYLRKNVFFRVLRSIMNAN